eukprot:2075189-Pleurochrysis_carterae.AAC.1
MLAAWRLRSRLGRHAPSRGLPLGLLSRSKEKRLTASRRSCTPPACVLSRRAALVSCSVTGESQGRALGWLRRSAPISAASADGDRKAWRN